MTRLVAMLGQRFERLVVIGFDRIEDRRAYWRVRCDCGQEMVVLGGNLRRGNTRSCGCLAKEQLATRSIIHGDARVGHKTSEYRTWCEMITRCENPNHIGYAEYGGRGITVCNRWRKSFAAFLQDMGRKPSRRHSIDRIDNSKNYEPDNCRWATAKEQVRNRSCVRLVVFQGTEMTLFEASEISRISVVVLSSRYHKGERGDRLFRAPRRSPRR